MRKRLSHQSSRSLFKKTANAVRAANLGLSIPRGGRRF